MRKFRYSLFIFLFFYSYLSFSQNEISCDTVYSKTNKKAFYIGGKKNLQKIIYNQTVPIVSESLKEDSTKNAFNKPDTICFNLLISKAGILESATIKESTIVFSSTNEAQLVSKICGIQKWKPAKKNGKAVCSHYQIKSIYKWY